MEAYKIRAEAIRGRNDDREMDRKLARSRSIQDVQRKQAERERLMKPQYMQSSLPRKKRKGRR